MIRSPQTYLTTLLACVLALGGCVATEDPFAKDADASEGKEDRWNSRNNPERFDGEFNYHLADLPLSGTAEREAWPSTYWPTYEDSINTAWHGDELSPAQKYDVAFNGWTPPDGFDALRPFDRNNPIVGEGWDAEYYDALGPLASHVSQNMGNRADREHAIANNGLGDADEWPVETWFGLCHAWVPAALLEDRPLRSVTYNGVEFHVGDIEALLIAAYNRSSADMIGGRCNTGAGDETVERDEAGRAIDVDCRDSNPGAMHVILTNYLGLLNRGFAFDRTYDYQVWNQPVSGFEVTRQDLVTAAEAMEMLGGSGETYTYNTDAVELYRVDASVSWITESHASTTPNETSRYTRQDHYSYILEVDGDGKIIGGEWIGSSRTRHPDFLWNPRRITRSSVPNLSITDVRMLVEMSRAPVTPEPGADELAADGEGGMAIPDNDADGITSVANVTGSGATTQVSVALDVTHTYIGDLEISLEHNGVTRTLHNREGGGTDNLARTFDVTGFEGADPSGTWSLHVADRAARDIGTLNSWRITLSASDDTPVPPPTDTVMTFAGAGGLAIPDNDANGISSTATVSGTDGDDAVAITVNITHTWIGDLEIQVEHNGRSWTLHDNSGGSDDNISETYPLDATGDAFSGDASGTWTLRVVDSAGADTGTLDSWAVEVR